MRRSVSCLLALTLALSLAPMPVSGFRLVTRMACNSPFVSDD